ncbi:MAG: hypothetical protein M3O77_05950 [Chloroflexota bacterium]|nr:hypothetical protein [Chloroflexota bacterium]
MTLSPPLGKPVPILQTRAERLDRAVDALLAGRPAPPPVDPGLRPLVDLAAALRTALLPVPAGSRLEARLAARLATRSPLNDGIRAIGVRARRELRSRERLLLAGAVSSAAVGVGVTAYAVWHRSGLRRS